MRALEFVEKLPALINKTADVDGIQVSINADGANVTAYATSDGRRLGYVVFDRDGNTLVPYDLAVEERYRGQGIAAVMYDYVKSLGFTIQASDDQTPDGKYFWRKNRGRKRVWESVQAYHGTFQPTLNKFNALSHFGTLQAAEDRLREKARREKIKTPGRVYEVVLDIKNPFVAKDFAGVHSPTHFVFDLKTAKLISQAELEAINRHIGTPKQAELLIKKLRELGFDSIAYKNKYEDKGSTSYVILDPSQVVSVRPVEQEETVTEARIPDEIEDFLYDLTPDDVGVEEFGPYRVHYEGFTDDCQSSADYCENPEAVYKQVFADHIAREGGRKPIEQNFTGDEDYPILYSIFKIPQQVKEISDQRLQDYLHRAGKRVDSRLSRMAQARERLNKGYEIYHADRPAGSNQIVDRFEANTPQEARRYYEKFIQDYESDVDFDLQLRRSTGIIENFADGRVKGKSRPGRVKKAGASCKGSVTSLRAKARKYGGEKGKMYHWCANMKGGKKKANEMITVPTVSKGKRQHLDVMPNDGRRIPKGKEAEYMGHQIGQLDDVEVWSYNQGPMRTFVVFDPATRISQLVVTGSRYPENPDSFVVKGLYSGPKNTTRAADLYAWLVRELGLVLVSDRKQSPGGQRVWQELEDRYGRSVNIYAYNMRTNEPVNTGTDDPESTHGTRGDVAQNVRLIATAK